MTSQGGRSINIALGIWLFVSAFLWHHGSWQFHNTWIVGLVMVLVALIALRVPAWRFVNGLVGIWLVMSGIGLPSISAATTWNNGLVGIAIFIGSVAGSGSEPRATRRVGSHPPRQMQ